MPNIVITAPEAYQPAAQELARQYGFAFTNDVKHGLCLVLDEAGLGLHDRDDKAGVVRVDFNNKAMGFRAQQASIKSEAIAKACGLKGNKQSVVLDATAGLARDAFVLASLGAKVMLLERSPVVAALLENGLRRAMYCGDSPSWVTERLSFLGNDSILNIRSWPYTQPDIVYLDPMFPHKKKSALVKKEMRLFQQLLGPDDDADLLLEPAISIAKERVVVKRPDYAPFLADKKPHSQIKSKKHRFDIYLASQ